MSIDVMTHVWKRARDVRGQVLLVLLAIADNADDDGYAFPGIKSLSERARISESSVHRAITQLKNAGWLEITPQGGHVPGRPRHLQPNLYRVLRGPWCQADTRCQEGVSTPGVIAVTPEPSLQNHQLEPSARARTRTGRPADFPITADMRAWAATNASHVDDLDWETICFLDYHEAKGNTWKNWTLAWQNWMKRAEARAAKIPKPRADEEIYISQAFWDGPDV